MKTNNNRKSNLGAFGKYYNRVAIEGILKSLFFSILVTSLLFLGLGLIFWFLGLNNALIIYISLILYIVIMITIALLYYFKKHIPTSKEIAIKIDRMGLEERLLTMNELKNDNSFMAIKQREDALKALSTIDSENIKIKISKKDISYLIVGCLISLIVGTFLILLNTNTIPVFKQLNNNPLNEENGFTISYIATEGGVINGSTSQKIAGGENGSPIMAAADEGYYFWGWSDGQRYPKRQEKEVQGDVTVTAIFAPLFNADDFEPDDSAPGTNPGNDPNKGMPDPNGQPDPNAPPMPQPSDDDKGDPDDSEGGGKSEPANQVINGETYYGDVYQGSYDDEMDAMSQNDEMSAKKKDIASSYLDSIAQN